MLIIYLGWALLICGCALKPPPLSPEEMIGIASQYPGDKAISEDSRVVFSENFEGKNLDIIFEEWGDVKHPGNLRLSKDRPQMSDGKLSLEIEKNGHLYSHFQGVDKLFARFYVKFHVETGYIHHFLSFSADSKPTPWPKGGAGHRPKGDQAFSVNIEPHGFGGRVKPPGVWVFYNYWHDMSGGWGNIFDSYNEIEPGRWYCIEIMIKANSADNLNDGEQALWVDGKLKAHFTGFWWRTTSDLKINTIWLSYYVTERNMIRNRDFKKDERVMKVWFDDIVLATDYIGPIVK